MTVTEMNEPVASGIRNIMNQKGLRQGWVAKQAGMTEQQLSDSLTGRRLFKARELLPLADALGVHIDEVFAAGLARGG